MKDRSKSKYQSTPANKKPKMPNENMMTKQHEKEMPKMMAEMHDKFMKPEKY